MPQYQCDFVIRHDEDDVKIVDTHDFDAPGIVLAIAHVERVAAKGDHAPANAARLRQRGIILFRKQIS